MSGLCTALALLDQRARPDRSIVMLEATSSGHGSVATERILRHPRDMGPARYCPAYHPKLHQLLNEFSIQTENVRFHRVVARSADQALLDRATALSFDTAPKAGQCTTEYFRGIWTEEELQRLCQLAGYGVVGEGSFPAAGAVEVLSTHPESFLSKDQEWRRPVEGFSALLNAMEETVLGGGVRIERGIHVSGVRESSEGLQIEGAVDGLQTKHLARRVVLAIPPRSLELVQHPWSQLRKWLRTQRSVPLFKGFLETSPGNLNEIDGLSVTGLHPLQKIYVDSRRNTVGWYCDGVAALCCAEAARRDPVAFRADAIRLLTAEARGLKPETFVNQPATLHFWPSGVTYGPPLRAMVRQPCVSATVLQWPLTALQSRSGGWKAP